jgi:hypothetical protein
MKITFRRVHDLERGYDVWIGGKPYRDGGWVGGRRVGKMWRVPAGWRFQLDGGRIMRLQGSRTDCCREVIEALQGMAA